jgi:hypothetical protein
MHTLDETMILSPEDFLKERPTWIARIRERRKARRLEVGPYATFSFECEETLRWQIQEMLRIEQGGDEQLQDELEAYAPLLPTGNDLVATLMFEIPDAEKRRVILGELGHIENQVFMLVGETILKAQPIGDDARTTEDGKTSAVHFLRFTFSPPAIQQFLDLQVPVFLSFSHPRYTHQAPLPLEMRQELMQDFYPSIVKT